MEKDAEWFIFSVGLVCSVSAQLTHPSITLNSIIRLRILDRKTDRGGGVGKNQITLEKQRVVFGESPAY